MDSVSKMIRMVRHSLNDESGNISPEGYRLAVQAAKETLFGNYGHFFHGDLIRTAQTLGVVKSTMQEEGYRDGIVHEPIEEFGTDELFEQIMTDEFMEVSETGLPSLATLYVVHSLQKIKNWQRFCWEGLAKAFNKMEGGSLGLGISHDPLIPVLADFVSGKATHHSLAHMEHIDFFQGTDGIIKVAS